MSPPPSKYNFLVAANDTWFAVFKSAVKDKALEVREAIKFVGVSRALASAEIKKAEDGDTPIGIVRPREAVALVGNSSWNKWQEKFLTDDYGAKVMEEYTKTEWTEEITLDEYKSRENIDTNLPNNAELGNIRLIKTDEVKAVPAKEAVVQQKVVDEEVEEEVTTTSLVDGKYVQKTETVTKTVKVPQYNEVDLYDKDGKVIGKHQVPIMETVEEAVAAVDAIPEKYYRRHTYPSDLIPDGITAPKDARVYKNRGKRQKLNPDYDASIKYKPREERDEWVVVGLLGQIPITKGQPMADSWVKMKDVSDTVEMYFVK